MSKLNKKRKQFIKNIDLYGFYCIIYLFDRGAGQTGNFLIFFRKEEKL